MTRRWRFLWWAVPALLLVPVVLSLLMLISISPERFRPQIERQVRERTGLPLTLSGPLSWKLWPLLSVNTGGGALQPTGAATPLLSWDNLSARASPLDLLRGVWDLDGIAIDGLQLHLRRGADGHGNWESLLADQQNKVADSVAQPDVRRAATAGGTPNPPGFAVQLRSLKLGNALLEYVDEGAGERYVARAVNLQAALAVRDGGDAIDVAALDVGLNALAPQLRNDGVPLALSLRELKYRAADRALSIDSYELGLASARATGAVQATTSATAHATLGGPMKLTLPGLRQWLAELGIEAPRLKDTTALGALSLSADWSLAEDGVAVSDLQMQLDDTQLQGEAHWWFTNPAHGRFDLQGDHIVLDRYQSATTTEPSEPFELPNALLKSLPIAGTLQWQQAQFQGNTLKGIRVRFIDHRVNEAAGSGGAAP
ncbi:MAG: AsmA family protein [Steroidobacteraceae bacterium]